MGLSPGEKKCVCVFFGGAEESGLLMAEHFGEVVEE